MTARIISIVTKSADLEHRPRDRYSRVRVERVLLVASHGIEGDTKSGDGKRQLNIMLAETIEQLRLEGFACAPGELGEQIVIAGLNEATPGSRWKLGETAVIELVELREPCGRFARIQGKSKKLATGRIGFMARVLVGGEIAVGAIVDRVINS